MQKPIQSAFSTRPDNRTSLGLTSVPLDRESLPERVRPHHPLVSNRRAVLSGALREEIHELRHRSEDARQTKSSILANLSHEFRTPLNAIMGFSELMLSEAMGKVENKRHREYISDIHASAFRLLDMVNVLLETADLTNGLTDLDRQNTDLIGLFSAVYDALKPMALKRQINLELDADSSACSMELDAERFSQAARQILSELIHEAGPGATILIRIDSGSETVSVSFACLAGRQKVTAVSFGSDRTRFVSSLPEHVGECRIDLDLSIAKTIIELHGGTLDFANGLSGDLAAALMLPRETR